MKTIAKRIMVILLALVLALALGSAACEKDEDSDDYDEYEDMDDSWQDDEDAYDEDADDEYADDDALGWLSWDLLECFVDNEWGDERYATLSFSDDGEVELNVGGLADYDDNEDLGYEIYEIYTGTYEIFIDETGEMTSGTMSFDLTLDWWISELGEDSDEGDLAYWDERQTIVGTYRFEAADGTLDLELISGQALMDEGWRGAPIETYSFWQTSFDDYYEENWDSAAVG